MPNYTENLHLVKPLQSEQYNIDVFNANADKIDQFAGQVPERALTADKLTTGAKINGVNFKGDTDIVTGAGFYYDTVTYGAGDLAFIYNQDGKLELYKSLSAGNIGHNPLTSTGYWEKVELGGSGGRNVGEIISSALPLTDAGLHLLDGTRLSGDGIYKGFVDYIADLYTENPSANYFCTEAQWQASVTQYGSCGKFVYNATNNTVRLPKVSDILQGTTDINALGDLVKAGLPNITGSVIPDRFGINGASREQSGAITITAIPSTDWYSAAGDQNGKTSRLNFNASRSSAIYGKSSTVQPQTIKVLYYIVIASSTKTDIQVDIDEVVTDLNGKADVDLTNVTDTGYIKMAGAGMPSSKYIDLTLGASGTKYTAPANGWFHLAWLGAGASCQFYNESAGSFLETKYGETQACSIQAKKGDTIKQYYTMGSASIRWFRFYYAVGSESEAS